MSNISKRVYQKAKANMVSSYRKKVAKHSSSRTIRDRGRGSTRVFNYAEGQLVKLRNRHDPRTFLSEKYIGECRLAMIVHPPYTDKYDRTVVDLLLDGEMLEGVTVGSFLPHTGE